MRDAPEEVIEVRGACPRGVDIVLVFVGLDEAGAGKASNFDLLAEWIRDGADPGLAGLSRGRRAKGIGEAVGIVEAGGVAERVFDGADVAEGVVRIGGG